MKMHAYGEKKAEKAAGAGPEATEMMGEAGQPNLPIRLKGDV
jgi:hypothetical protein